MEQTVEQYLNEYADKFLDGIDTTRPFGRAWKQSIIRSERHELLNRGSPSGSASFMYFTDCRLAEYAILESNGTADYLSQLMWDGEE